MEIESTESIYRGKDLPDAVIEKRQAIIGDLINFFTDLGLREDTATAGKAEVERLPGSSSPKGAILWRISRPVRLCWLVRPP